MGFQALELLLEHIEGRKKDVEIVQVPMRLVIRQSCGCQPDALPPRVFTVAAQQISSADRSSLAQQITQAMAETVLAEAQRLGVEEVENLCQHLVEAFSPESGKRRSGESSARRLNRSSRRWNWRKTMSMCGRQRS